jgi:hypothetical protein
MDMSPRRDKRSFIALPLRAYGTDAAGKNFRQPVCTLDLSAEGARIHGLTGIAAGQIITLENKKNKVRFEVVWVGERNTPRQGQVGLRTLEPDKLLAELELQRGGYEDPWTPPEKPKVQPQVQEDRRAMPRFDCDRSVQYWKEDEKTPTWGTLENISLSGCFVTTRWPLPVQTRVRVVIFLHGLKISASGQVRAPRADEGMGIMFTSLSRESRVRLKKAVQRLAQKSGETTAVGTQQGGKNGSEEMLEAVRAWFDQNLTMSWAEFFDIAIRSKGNLPVVVSQSEEDF